MGVTRISEDPDRRKYRDAVGGAQRNIRKEIEATVENESTVESVRSRTKLLNDMRKMTTGDEPDFESWRDKARTIKEEAIDNLPELVDQVTEVIEERGGHVYLADTPEEANDYISEVCDRRDAELVVKSKSMTTEEIELNDALEDSDFRVVETDLGEFVAQLAGERPSHIIGPILHKPQEEIAQLFHEKLGVEVPDDADGRDLTRIARDVLREEFENADVGITGANFVTADTGTIALVTNEGNARWTTEAPSTHIAVAGIEKIVPRFEDLQPFYELLPKSATGQPSTSYFTMLTPPVRSESIDYAEGKTGDERELHLVLVDNGRTEMSKDPVLKESLYCIRCGACLNTCANFQAVGGHVYGGETYTGGIGNAWEAGVTGKEEAESFNDLCTGCSQCKPACPVKIDIPWLNTAIRDRLNRGLEREDVEGFVFEGLMPGEDSTNESNDGFPRERRFWSNFERRAKTGSRFAPLSNWAANSFVGKKLLQKLYGFAPERDVPAFSKPFTSKERVDEDNQVVVFAEAYSNYLHPERLEAVVKVLEHSEIDFGVSDTSATGRDALSQGMIERARRDAEKTFEKLEPYIESGSDVVVVEPSVSSLFLDEYAKLLDENQHAKLVDSVFEVCVYIDQLHERGGIELPSIDEEVFLHGHCQQRASGQFDPTVSLLEKCGCDVSVSDVECCGMAGSFGYKQDYYELSMEVGEPLFDDIEHQDRTVLASGTSCKSQIEDGTSEKVTHPIEFIAEYL